MPKGIKEEKKKIEFDNSEEPPSSSSPYYEEWNDWKWQIRNSITTKEELEKHIELTKDELDFFKIENNKHISFRVTPYYMDLVKKNPELRKCVIPRVQEFEVSKYESEDPLQEEKNSPVSCLVHKYPDRCLLLVTPFCSISCRYCTRSRLISNHKEGYTEDKLLEAIEYIKKNKSVRDVIVSGGDPFTLSNNKIYFILDKLYSINHVEVIRIGTKTLAVLPQRFNDEELTSLILPTYSDKLFINHHVSHYAEITLEMKKACLILSRLGIPLGSQTVLLKDVNDDIETMKLTMQKLLTCKTIPRYLYQMDRIKGGNHFSTSIEKGIEIIKGIQGHTSGMACPRYVVDSEIGKIPVDIGYTIEKEKDYYIFQNYKGEKIGYYE